MERGADDDGVDVDMKSSFSVSVPKIAGVRLRRWMFFSTGKTSLRKNREKQNSEFVSRTVRNDTPAV